MNVSEPDTLDELIADCADIPNSLCTCHHYDPAPPAAAQWAVDDACLAQVKDIDAYV